MQSGQHPQADIPEAGMTFVREQGKDPAYGECPGNLPCLRFICPWLVVRNRPGEQPRIETERNDFRQPG